jgi:hypothetical protein
VERWQLKHMVRTFANGRTHKQLLSRKHFDRISTYQNMIKRKMEKLLMITQER